MVRFRNSLRVGEEFVGVQCRALPEPPAAPVEFVAAFLQNNVNHRAAVVAELRRETVIFDLEFLHYFYGRLIVHVSRSAFALFRCAGQRPIDPDLRGGVALTIGDEIGSRWVGVSRPLSSRFRNSTSEKYQTKKTAIG